MGYSAPFLLAMFLMQIIGDNRLFAFLLLSVLLVFVLCGPCNYVIAPSDMNEVFITKSKSYNNT